MARIFFLALFIFITLSPFAYSQNENDISANVNVSAEVTQTIQMITVNSMQFGDAQPGQREIYVNPVNSVKAGFMIAVGTPEAEFRLNYLSERELTQIDGEGNLTFIYEISANDEEDQASSELLNVDSRNLQFNQEGRYYIWLGGRVNIENAAPGNYEGDFTIEIDYI